VPFWKLLQRVCPADCHRGYAQLKAIAESQLPTTAGFHTAPRAVSAQAHAHGWAAVARDAASGLGREPSRQPDPMQPPRRGHLMADCAGRAGASATPVRSEHPFSITEPMASQPAATNLTPARAASACYRPAPATLCNDRRLHGTALRDFPDRRDGQWNSTRQPEADSSKSLCRRRERALPIGRRSDGEAMGSQLTAPR